MTDIAAAPSNEAAPSPPAEAPAQTTADITPLGDNPIHSEPVPDKPIKVEVVTPKPKTAMDSLKEAQAKSDRNEKDRIARETAKVELKADAPKLDDKGQPIVEAKPVTDASKPKIEPPSRWTPTAKAKWEALDDEVKAETDRTVKELEKGMNTYKERAAKMDDLKEYEDIAKQYKTDIKTALSNYVALDKSLQSENPAEKLSALDQVFKAAKIDKAEFARFILGQEQEQGQQPQQMPQEIVAMQRELAQLRQQVQGNTQFTQDQQRQQVENHITQWAADKPMADMLAPQIAEHVQQGLSLDDAYAKAVSTQQDIARQMGFVSPAAIATPAAAQPQTLKGTKSITGSPSAGSYQATNKPSSSNIEAVRKAMEAAGLSL
jgi:hypothetical protein